MDRTAGRPQSRGVARADRKSGTGIGGRLGVFRPAQSAGTGHRFGHLTGNGFNAGQGLRGTQGHLQHANATGHQSTSQGHGMGHIVQNNDRNHGRVGHHVQGGQVSGQGLSNSVHV